LLEPFLSSSDSESLLTYSQYLIVVKTKYQPSSNLKKAYPKNNQGCFQFTEKQRKAASMANQPKDFQDFVEQVRSSFFSLPQHCTLLFFQFTDQLKMGKCAQRTQYT
jgi:hypothetical protein